MLLVKTEGFLCGLSMPAKVHDATKCYSKISPYSRKDLDQGNQLDLKNSKITSSFLLACYEVFLD